MKQTDLQRFSELLSDAMAFYRQDVSRFALSVWWQACQPFEFESIGKALTAHAMDPERGQWAPKPADIVRHLRGTVADRALIAWGKTLDAIERVGAYQSVAFDDPVIHAVIDDLGGWVALCRSESDSMQFVQRRFTDAYRAYSSRPDIRYPAKLIGESEQQNAIWNHKSSPPTLIGDPEKAKQTLACGAIGPKTQITSVEGIRRIGSAA